MGRSGSLRVLGFCTFAAAWLLALTVLNAAAGGTLRATLLYAVPVAITAWHGWRLGFLFAAPMVRGNIDEPFNHKGLHRC